MNTWHTIDSAVWGGLRTFGNLKVLQWGWDLSVYYITLLPVHYLHFVLAFEDIALSFLVLLPYLTLVAMPSHYDDFFSLWDCKPK